MFGSLAPRGYALDPEATTQDPAWMDAEAQANLAAIEAAKKPPAKSWYDTINDVAHFPHRMFGALSQPLPGGTPAPVSLGSSGAAFGTLSPGEEAARAPDVVSNIIGNTGNAVAEAVHSGVTAPHDAMTGELPMTGPDGNTSPEAIRRAFDLASIAGGGSVAGTAEKAAQGAGTDFRVLGKKIGGETPAAPVSDLAAPYHGMLDGAGQTLASDSGKPGAAIAAAEHAPPFYSGLEKAVEAMPQAKMPANQVLATLANKGGIKGEEVAATGLDRFLAEKGAGAVTKQELLDHVGANKVQLGEVTKGGPPTWQQLTPEQKDHFSEVYQERFDDHTSRNPNWAGVEDFYNRYRDESPRYINEVIGGRSNVATTKYHDYQLPGGENYREKLLTLPPTKNATEQWKVVRPDGHVDSTWAGEAEAKSHAELVGGTVRQAPTVETNGGYRSSHWDEPNVLVHRRTNERGVQGVGEDQSFKLRNKTSGNTTKAFPTEEAALAHLETLPEKLRPNLEVVPAGSMSKPSLHVEEIQSDWHQQGRQKGYGPGESHNEFQLINDQGRSEGVFPTMQEAEAAKTRLHGTAPYFGSLDRNDTSGWMVNTVPVKTKSGVPDAPFKKNWHELALKDAIREAAAKGIDRISWTPGEAQAARYDLSKKLSEVTYHPRTKSLVARDLRGEKVLEKTVEPDGIADYIGKDAAKNLLESPATSGPGRHKINGEGLQVGGSGMRGFYDKMIPDALNKIGKPHGVKVERGTTVSPNQKMRFEGDEPPRQYWRDIARDIDQRGNVTYSRQWRDVTKAVEQGQSFVDAMSEHGSRGLADFVGGEMKLADQTHPVHYMDIPPSLKEQALKKGFSLFEDSSAGQGIAAASHAKPYQQLLDKPEHGGLSFPPEEAADRLRMNLQREQKAAAKGTELPGAPSNERTVIPAPKGSGLPDYVAGKLTPEDWVKRHEKMLSPEEIHGSAKWYDEIYGEFLKHTNGDADLAKKYMRSWLVAQQNADVSSSMANMLLQREQVQRGVPEAEMKAGGMPNPTVAARRVMQDQPITEGVGQKIADFVDAAEGKSVRSWMGNKPEGGKPFVVDVHTARDTGMVDQELKNHLTRLGYDKSAVEKLKTDLGTSPTATQYENRVKFGHELTDYLNARKWQGRDDWTPKEVQAIGWMGMTKLTANKADNISTGLERNMRHLSMELAPGEGSPWDAKYGKRFAALPPEKQRELTHSMAQDAIKRASELAGVDVRDIVHGTGGWQHFQNPSTVAQTFSSKQGAEIAANALGHLLQQTEVWSNKVKPLTTSPKGFAVDLIANGKHNLGTDAGLREFWGKIMEADPTAGGKNPLFQGYQPIKMPDGRVGIRVLIDRGGEGTKNAIENAISGPIKSVVEKLPHDVEIRRHEAEIYKARNDWKEQPNGEGYRQRLVDLIGPDRAAQLDRHGAQLEGVFKRALEAAEAGTGTKPALKKKAATKAAEFGSLAPGAP